MYRKQVNQKWFMEIIKDDLKMDQGFRLVLMSYQNKVWFIP